jgi:hypothetical protein
MKYEPKLYKPLTNARRALRDLNYALFDMATVYSTNGDYDKAGKIVNARDTLYHVDQIVEQIDSEQIRGLLSNLEID